MTNTPKVSVVIPNYNGGASSGPLGANSQTVQLLRRAGQGNLAQVWGVPRGYSPQVQAEWFYALDEIGIDVPPPDWKTGEHVYAVKEQVLKEHKDRFGAGLLRFMKEAKKRGIYTTFIYTNSEQKWIDRFKEVGKYYLGYDFGERYACSFKSTLERTGKPAEAITLDDLADLAVDELQEITGQPEDEASALIMKAREHWFTDQQEND